MSIIQQVIDSEDKASFISNIETLSPEIIPILIDLYIMGDSPSSKAASEALIKVCRDTDFSNEVSVIKPNFNEKSKSSKTKLVETRIPCSKPSFSEVTIHLLEYAIHMFTTLASKYAENLRLDALPVFQKLYDSNNFLVTKKMILDTCNFLLLFFSRSDEYRKRAYNLLYQIQGIAQKLCDVEAVIAVQSLLYLFPEENVQTDNE